MAIGFFEDNKVNKNIQDDAARKVIKHLSELDGALRKVVAINKSPYNIEGAEKVALAIETVKKIIESVNKIKPAISNEELKDDNSISDGISPRSP